MKNIFKLLVFGWVIKVLSVVVIVGILSVLKCVIICLIFWKLFMVWKGVMV